MDSFVFWSRNSGKICDVFLFCFLLSRVPTIVRSLETDGKTVTNGGGNGEGGWMGDLCQWVKVPEYIIYSQEMF